MMEDRSTYVIGASERLHCDILVKESPFVRTFRLKASSLLELNLLVTSGRRDCRIDIFLEGEGASCDVAGLCTGGGDDRMDIHVNLNHISGGCTSRQLFKNILSGNARVSFDGLIHVERDAQKTKAYQACHSLLLDSGARAESRPQLEIWADDVECSHGATIGQGSEDEIFYMRSRGISLPVARMLQKEAFAREVTSRITDAAISAEIEEILKN